MAHLIPDNIRTREDVPAAYRRVATALKLGLDDGAMVWFEPLFDASDSKPHFIALLPDNGLAVLEVLDVRTSKLLGALRGKLRIERDGVEVEADQPLVRAEAYAQVLRTRVAAEERLEGVQLPVAAAALLPLLGRQAAHDKGLADTGLDLDRCLFREEVEAAVAGDDVGLDKWFARLLGSATPIEGGLVDVVRGLVQPDLVIDRPEEGGQLAIFRPPEGEDLVRVMDRRQEALAKSIGDGHRVVRGVAGSGKTLILVYRARLLAQILPDQRFLLACYNRSLASELGALLSDHENVEVEPVHVLIGRAIRAAGLDDPGFADDTGEERAAAGLQALERGALARYRAVMLDEAQDLGPNGMRFVASLADDRFNDVLVVADAAQNVYRRSFTWKDAGIQAQGRTRILRRNYRNTREIVELAHGFLVPGGSEEASLDLEDEAVIVPPEAAVRSGPVPTVLVSEPAELVDLAFAELAGAVDDGSPPKSVGALTIGGWEAIELERRLRGKGIEHYFVSDPQDKSKKDKVAEADAPLILSTVYSAKGLEFQTVILCCTPRRGQDDLDELRRAIYVGMTRATERLFVFADTEHPLLDDLRGAADGKARLVGVSDG